MGSDNVLYIIIVAPTLVVLSILQLVFYHQVKRDEEIREKQQRDLKD